MNKVYYRNSVFTDSGHTVVVRGWYYIDYPVIGKSITFKYQWTNAGGDWENN